MRMAESWQQTLLYLFLAGNGDVLSYEDYEYNMEKCGVAGCMIARWGIIHATNYKKLKEVKITNRNPTELVKM